MNVKPANTTVSPGTGLLHRQHMECNMAFIAELEGRKP